MAIQLANAVNALQLNSSQKLWGNKGIFYEAHQIWLWPAIKFGGKCDSVFTRKGHGADNDDDYDDDDWAFDGDEASLRSSW